jgi:hypothetical protein
MEAVLRPAVKGFDYATLGEHFRSEKQKQFTTLEGADRDIHQRIVKDRGEVTRSLRKYEINH